MSWPEKMLKTDGLGVISDLQCGGWSTTLLTAKGALYTVGVIDGLALFRQDPKTEPLPLRYPPGFPHPYDRYDASTAIKQFSSGRAHILGLTDSGRIWSWQNIEHAALHVRFIQYDTVENGASRGNGVVSKVVAGWEKSAALIEGTGIVLWEPLRRGQDDMEIEDTALVLESVVVPKTGYVDAISRSDSRHQRGGNNGTELIGEVRNFIVLEEVVVFNTHIGKVFVAQILWSNRGQMVSKPLELDLPVDETGEAAFATDVQGSFHSFAVFTRSGAVLTSHQDHLLKLLRQEPNDRPLFTLVPALQNRNVIQLAFGDYHFHALHSSGYITSYGTEPQRCGALGLGGHGGPDSRLRGVRSQGAGGDIRLIPHAYAEGRRIWFEREKRAWIDFLTSGGVDPAEAQDRIRMALGVPAIHCQGEISEWVEQQGRDWEEKFGVKGDDEDGLGAYFVLSVTAAGWHSGALVLENRDLVEKLRRACEIPDPAVQPFRSLQDESTSSESGGTSSLLGMAIATGSDWGRWALGMAPYDPQSIARISQGEAGNTANAALMKRGMHAINFGAAPRVGFLYKVGEDARKICVHSKLNADLVVGE